MKALVAAFNQEKALVGAFSVITNLRMDLRLNLYYRYSVQGDDLTRHAACPVLAGTKWVSNLWIHERGQEFTRSCSTDPFV